MEICNGMVEAKKNKVLIPGTASEFHGKDNIGEVSIKFKGNPAEAEGLQED